MVIEGRSKEPGYILPSGTRIAVDDGMLELGKPIDAGASAFTRQAVLTIPEQTQKQVNAKIFRNFRIDGNPMDPDEPDNEASVQRRLTEERVPHILPFELYTVIRNEDGFLIPEGAERPDIYIAPAGIHLIATMLARYSLRSRIEKGNMQPQDIILLIGSVAEALKGMHELNIVHGDVKPPNILLAVDDTWKLGDFGVAIDDPTGNFWDPSFGRRASRAYTAQELLGSVNAKRGPKTDQFSLGVVLHEAATGKLAVSAEYSESMKPFKPVAEKGMSRNPEDRYRDMGEFKEAFVQAGQEAKKIAKTRRRIFGGEDIPK